VGLGGGAGADGEMRGDGAGAAAGLAGDHHDDPALGRLPGRRAGGVETLEDRARSLHRDLGKELAGAASEGAEDDVGVVARIDGDYRKGRRGVADRGEGLLEIAAEIDKADIAAVARGEGRDRAAAGALGYGYPVGAGLGEGAAQSLGSGRDDERLPDGHTLHIGERRLFAKNDGPRRRPARGDSRGRRR
jgi:hypothetical protein